MSVRFQVGIQCSADYVYTTHPSLAANRTVQFMSKTKVSHSTADRNGKVKKGRLETELLLYRMSKS